MNSPLNNQNDDDEDDAKVLKRAKIALLLFFVLASIGALVWAASFLRGL